MKYIYLLALAGFAAGASAGFSQTVSVPITNNSFETPNVTGESSNAGANSHTYQQGAGTSTFVTGWNTVSSGGIFTLINSSSIAGQNGSQHLENFSLGGTQGYNGAGTVSQILTTSFVAGAIYSLTAEADVTSGTVTGDTFFIANSSGVVLASTPITGTTVNTFSTFTVAFASTGLVGDTGQIEVGFTSPSQTTQGNMEIDNFVLSETPALVPEPGSVALAALGGFSLLGCLPRRRMA
jgi:hypothetical protein